MTNKNHSSSIFLIPLVGCFIKIIKRLDLPSPVERWPSQPEEAVNFLVPLLNSLSILPGEGQGSASPLQINQDSPFDALMEERQKEMRKEIDDIKGRVNNLVFMLLGAILLNLLIRLIQFLLGRRRLPTELGEKDGNDGGHHQPRGSIGGDGVRRSKAVNQ